MPVIFTNKLKVVGTRRGFSVKPSSVGGNSDSRLFGTTELRFPTLRCFSTSNRYSSSLLPSSAYDTPAYTPFSFAYSPDYPVQIPYAVVSRAPDTQDHSHTVPDAPPSDFPRIPGQSHTDFYHNPGSSFSMPSDALSVSLYMQGHFPAAFEHIPVHTRDLSPCVSCWVSRGYDFRGRAFLRRSALLILALLFTTHGIILKGIFESIQRRRVRHALGFDPLPDSSIEMHPRTSIREPFKRFQPFFIPRARLGFRPKNLYTQQFNILIRNSLRRLDTRIESVERTNTKLTNRIVPITPRIHKVLFRC